MAEQGLRRTGGTELNLESMGVNLPYNMQAEQSVLGAALLQADIIPELVELLRPEMFYARQNGQIFAEMVRLFTAGQTVDFVTLLDAVTGEGVFESADAAKVYLTGLAETVPSISNVQAYAKIVQEKYLVRQLMGAAKDILEQSGEEPDADLLLESAEQKIYEIRSGRDTSALTSISSVIVDTLVNLQKIAGPDRDKYAGIPTGFTYLDTVLTGMGRSDLIILAARPGMGKTSFFYGPFGFGYTTGGNRGGSYGYGGAYGPSSAQDTTVELQAARNYINARRYREALNALSGVAESARTARWYYYSALANWGLGNSITALQHAQRACQMEPGNSEYQQLLSRLQSGGQTYQSASRSYSTPGLSVGRLCLSFWLLNLLFRCFCGFW